MKLRVPTTNGDVEIKGVRVGDFLVHEPANGLGLDWNVTHIASRMRFPSTFEDRKGAMRFARQVKHLMDWSKVECGRDPNSTVKAAWISGEPTKEQKAAVKKLAQDCGAF